MEVSMDNTIDDDKLLADKRRLKRRHLIYYLRVFSNPGGELIGHLVDITGEGVMLISEKPVAKDTEYEMRMVLPFEILSVEAILFKATCIWSKKDVNPDFYASGFKIEGLAASDIKIIEELIEQYGFND
jgi:hypothetical protein